MNKLMYVAVPLIFFASVILPQENKKEIEAIRVTNAPKIDGLIDEEIWEQLPQLVDFMQFDPYNGAPASQKTFARVCYDDEALYIGAFMQDSAPDSIGFELGLRDSQDEPNAELFTAHISPYNDGMNSVYFAVSCVGVQTDFKLSVQGIEGSWDAVWESEVVIREDGWSAEMKIPFSALRFPDTPVQEWGFNLFRYIPRYREWNNWSYVSNKMDQWWKHMGLLKGINNVEAPLRLSFSPYISSYVEKNQFGNWGYSYNGGMDLKYGIDDRFTLDMTLIPDFGQVEFDDEELNLTPYEIQYNEKRQFFTEGTELFNKGELFYSRRIGSTPSNFYGVYGELNNDEVISENPTETQIINVSKLSGRTNGGLGIGVMNAMTANTYATVRDTLSGNEREILTQSFTNYNFLVFDQSLTNNSYVSLINSNVWRKDYLANVTASEFRLADSQNQYSVKGVGALSQIHAGDDHAYGYKAALEAGKVSGEFQYGYELFMSSNKYNQNDFGYLRRNNEINQAVWFKYSIYDPFAIFRNMSHQIEIMYDRMYQPSEFSSVSVSYEFNTLFKNNYHFAMHALLAPFEGRDYYEPRIQGRYLTLYKYFHNCFSFNTNPVLPFYAGFSGGFSKSYDYDFDFLTWHLSASPRMRFSDQFSIGYSLLVSNTDNEVGYVSKDGSLDKIYFGKRDRTTITNTFEAAYLFNNAMSVNFRLRHYWSKAEYDSFYDLLNDGSLSPSVYAYNHDINYNAFTIDMIYTWNFAPGSELLLVWKNSVYNTNSEIGGDYFTNFNNTIDSPQINSFSIKILYYIDYLNL